MMFVILLCMAIAMLASVLDGGVVTDRTLQGALCTYLLLGVSWAYLYATLQRVAPGSINLPIEVVNASTEYHEVKLQFVRLLYFSFTTLTTLGLGDITPISSFAKMAVCLEAITGQLYIALLISRLVGMHIATGRAEQG